MSRPLVVLPFDLSSKQTGGQNSPPANSTADDPMQVVEPRRRTNKTLGRQTRILKIFLKLVQINAVSENLEILDENGQFIRGSDVSKLLGLTQNSTRQNPGLDALIKQLKNARVDPEIIINEIIKNQLREFSRSSATLPKQVDTGNQRKIEDFFEENPRNPKRARMDSPTAPRPPTPVDNQNITPENSSWDIPLPDTEDDDTK